MEDLIGAGRRELVNIVRAPTPTHRRLRYRLAFVLIATVTLDAVASLLIFAFEHDAPGTEITNLGDAVFWTSTQLLTVSSQLPESDLHPGAHPRPLPAGLRDLGGRDPRRLVRRLFHRRGMEIDPPSGSTA